MNISKVKVQNFKCFRDPNELELKPGFNVLTGQNSAGKTALLEAMTLQAAASPNRSLQTIPVPGASHSQESSVRMTLSLTREELFGLMGIQQHMLLVPEDGFPIPGTSPYQLHVRDEGFLQWLAHEPDFEITVQRSIWSGGGERLVAAEERPLGKYAPRRPEPDGTTQMVAVVAENGTFRSVGSARGERTGYLSTTIAGALRTRIYRFWAERFIVGQCAFGHNSVLAPNAQNLPEAINTLTANPERLRDLNELVREILPQVRQVSVRALPVNQVQLIVWPHPPTTRREDLAIPLNECGSGVGQVLAILYVVLTSDHPQVILVDEPQSFLHPGAVRKLIDVLKRYPRHQYIFSTHSPTVITGADPATITMVSARDGEASLQAINPANTKDLEAYLLDIGARLSDVFGADNILWVEGQTEETCFPRILAVVADRRLMGTSVLGIRQTGDLQAREKRKIFEIYERLSGANSLIPPALAFVFDSECLSETDKQDMQRAGRDLVKFLPRRMYENFLLDPEAIAAVVNAIEGFRPVPVRGDEVGQLLGAKRADARHYCRGEQVAPGDWISRIDGAGVLRQIFAELSENRVSYDKMRHSVAITEWILKQRPEVFRELADWLVACLAGH